MSDNIHRAGMRKSALSLWLDWLGKLLVEELAPRPRRFGSSLRSATIATIGAGLMAACHELSPLGPYVVWLLLGNGAPMMSPRRAFVYLLATAPIIAAAVPIAGILAETPWLMLPFLGAFTATSSYLIVSLKLGPIGLVWQVITLDTFYGVIFEPRDFGWNSSAIFGGCVIAFTLVSAFDTWIWPDPAEAILLDSLAGNLKRISERFVQSMDYYLDEPGARRPGEPPAASELPLHVELLDRAGAEGISHHRRAVLLAVITVAERLHARVDRLMIAVREDVPHRIRTLLRPELRETCDGIAAALEEREREVRVRIRTGPDLPPPPAAARAARAIETLQARVIAVRPQYIRSASGVEISNTGAILASVSAMVRLIERPLDEPPEAAQPQAASHAPAVAPDPGLVPYCLKVAVCICIGYVIGLTTQRADLSTILTTIIVTALPTYGASLRKTILRNVGGLVGGALSLLAIIVATPNFASLPAYMMVSFVLLFISAYTGLSSGRVAYAGKQIGTTFLLVYAGLSPAPDIYSPLWRTWGILLGTIVVMVVYLTLWPKYAGDSLLPRLRRVIADTLSLMPDSGLSAVAEINRVDFEITQLLTEILSVADDARLEGRRSLIDHDAVVQSAGTIRRMAHRLSSALSWLLKNPPPPLDDTTQAAATAAYGAMRARLESWHAFFESAGALQGESARALAAQHSRDEIAKPFQQFIKLIEEDGFARIAGWPLEQRSRLLEEVQSLRRMEFLLAELDVHLARIPGAAPAGAAGTDSVVAPEAALS